MEYYRLPKGYGKEIKHFQDRAAEFLNGSLSPDDFKKITPAFGIYEQKTAGTYMQRVRLAGGIITPELFGELIDLAEKYAGGFLHITTRQNVQFQGVAPENLGRLQEELGRLSLLTKTSGGNCVRNVLIDQFAGVSKDDAFDVTPYGLELSNRLAEYPEFAGLPRKFKIALSSSAADRTQAKIADLGLIAVKKGDKKGFEAYTGGGLGAKSKTGFKIADFIPAENILKTATAFTRLFAKHGGGVPRGQARLRFLIERLGEETFRELLAEELKAVSRKRSLKLEAPSTWHAKPAESSAIDKNRWFSTFVTTQKQKNRYTVKIPLFFGHISKETAERIVLFCKKYPETEIRFTQTQNILLRNVAAANLAEVRRLTDGINELGEKNGFLSDIKACAGTDFCRLSIAGSSKLLKKIIDGVSAEPDLKNTEDVRIGISGCPNGCAHTVISDIGFSGKQKKVGDEVREAYKIFIGGTPEKLGTEIGELFTEEIPAFVNEALKKYEGSTAKSFAEYLAKSGEEEIKGLLG